MNPCRILLAFLLLACAACSRLPPPDKAGELVVGIRQTPAFYTVEDGVHEGFEHDLITRFAASLNVKPRFVTAADSLELEKLLAAGKIHLASSMPLVGDTLPENSIGLRTAAQWVVAHADSLGPDTLDDLRDQTVETAAASSPAASLRKLDEKQRPKLVEHPGINEYELLRKVAARYSDLVATDEIHLGIASNLYPDLRPAVKLPGHTVFGWVFPDDGASGYGAALREKASAFVADFRKDGGYARLEDRYFGNVKRLDATGVAKFIEDIGMLLPHYRPLFLRAQASTGLDWRLIAALAYQESKWDPLATSPTGVRGMMMLTEITADHLNVRNRLDPQESVLAGARYLKDLADQLPASVRHPDRLWLALAAYNLGAGHLSAGRNIAQSMNRDPNSWTDMKQTLPMLARPEIYARLKSGKARGGEAVILVENIRSYFQILGRFETAYSMPYPVPYKPPTKLR